jgi:calcineurin-like phosphoesterase
MEGKEITIIRLPAKVRIEYEFTNPFKDTNAGQTKFSIDVEIYLTNKEAEALDEELINIMLRALNTIFEARKLEQDIEAVKEVFDADPA